MNSHSQETLRKIENDKLAQLKIGSLPGGFVSTNSSDYTQLGTYIGENTHLKTLWVKNEDSALDVANTGFFDGLRRNTSIYWLELKCNNREIVGTVIHEILNIYQEKNSIRFIVIYDALLQNGGYNFILETFRRCTNINIIGLCYCNITGEQLLPMVEVFRGGNLLELHLSGNGIGNAGCEVLATLLSDPNCSIQKLHLDHNNIGNEGVATIGNSLANNTKLTTLFLYANPIHQPSALDLFARVLCDTSSVNNTFTSNHTLQSLTLPNQMLQAWIWRILNLNSSTNKSRVAIEKVIKCHPNIDMEPLLNWNMEGECDQDLKALPYVISWFERALEALPGDMRHSIYKRKLTAIYQFAKALPLLFVPASHIKRNENKRKRED